MEWLWTGKSFGKSTGIWFMFWVDINLRKKIVGIICLPRYLPLPKRVGF
jgi:hypothetical protein